MRKIVICGSMSLISNMKYVAKQLDLLGYTAFIPQEDDWESIPKERLNEYKRKVSLRHFSEIAKDDTYAILVVNDAKKGVCNYIGANAFAEIAIAFYFGKTIFLLNDMYAPLADELSGWGAIPLKGDMALTAIKHPYTP